MSPPVMESGSTVACKIIYPYHTGTSTLSPIWCTMLSTSFAAVLKIDCNEEGIVKAMAMLILSAIPRAPPLVAADSLVIH